MVCTVDTALRAYLRSRLESVEGVVPDRIVGRLFPRDKIVIGAVVGVRHSLCGVSYRARDLCRLRPVAGSLGWIHFSNLNCVALRSLRSS